MFQDVASIRPFRSRFILVRALLGMVAVSACATQQAEAEHPKPPLTVRWPVNSTTQIGGYAVAPVGKPTLVEGGAEGICFDGDKDALIFPINPLAGQYDFTVQVLFKPLPQGEAEQKIVHLESEEGGGRVILETRLFADGTWHLHSFVRSEQTKQALSATQKKHPTGKWYWAALTYSNGWLRHYVNGIEQGAIQAKLGRMEAGRMSLATRINLASFFKGCIRELRFANQGLPPEQLARDVNVPPPAPAEAVAAESPPATTTTDAAPVPVQDPANPTEAAPTAEPVEAPGEPTPAPVTPTPSPAPAAP